jgi:CRP/FNR family cyclic AMP-dependent transcriptional regulator
MASKNALIDHLRQVPLFANCSTKELQRIAKVATERHIPAGQAIVDQGQAGTEAYVLMEGTATVRRNGKKVATLEPGAVIGELSLLDRGPRTATVITDAGATVLVVGQRDFQPILAEIPAIAEKVLASLAGRIRELDRKAFG